MTAEQILEKLASRRRQLRMSYSVLAKRSGVSMPTVVRLLSGRNPQSSFGNVLAIAEALGIAFRFEAVPLEEFLERQAKQKAEKLVGMVQGNLALEEQAVDVKTIARMKRKTVLELLAGSAQRLWG
jgi:transcriptional regulator with XRE-family HTH domain